MFRIILFAIGSKYVIPVDHFSLVLNEDGDIHEHLVQLLDGSLELDEHLVPAEYIIQSGDQTTV